MGGMNICVSCQKSSKQAEMPDIDDFQLITKTHFKPLPQNRCLKISFRRGLTLYW